MVPYLVRHTRYGAISGASAPNKAYIQCILVPQSGASTGCGMYYLVHLGDHRSLTLCTFCPLPCSAWVAARLFNYTDIHPIYFFDFLNSESIISAKSAKSQKPKPPKLKTLCLTRRGRGPRRQAKRALCLREKEREREREREREMLFM